MRLPHETMEGTVTAGVVLTIVLFSLARFLLTGLGI